MKTAEDTSAVLSHCTRLLCPFTPTSHKLMLPSADVTRKKKQLFNLVAKDTYRFFRVYLKLPVAHSGPFPLLCIYIFSKNK